MFSECADGIMLCTNFNRKIKLEGENMGAVKEWSFLICLTSIIATSIEFLIPPGKIGKTINLLLGLFSIMVFFSPFSNKYRDFKSFFKNDIFKNIQASKIPEKNSISENINNQVMNTACEKLKLIVSKNLKNINICPKKIQVFMDKDEHGRIVMIRCKISLNSKDINLKEKIKNEIESKLNIKTEVVENES